MDMEINPSNRARLAGKIKKNKESVAESERTLRKALTAMSNSAAARDELFSYDGTNEDQVRQFIPSIELKQSM